MKIIRMTRNCALRFLEEAHRPGGLAEHLTEAHEKLLFSEGVINILAARRNHTTIVRFLPALEFENDLLKKQQPTMQGEAIRMMLMSPLSTGSSLLGYIFLVKNGGKLESRMEYGATKAAFRAFYKNGKKQQNKLKHTITLARTVRDLILLTQYDMFLHESEWSAEEVTARQTPKERWPEDPFEVVFEPEIENQKRLSAPDYVFYLNRDYPDLKPASDKQMQWVTNWAEQLRSKMKDPDALQRLKLDGFDSESMRDTEEL